MVHGYGTHFYYATRSAKDCPNVWELAWYYDKGDIRWDGEAAFLFRGKIYHGGAWIKKQSEIAAENSTTVAALKNTYPGVHHGNSDDLIHPDGGAMNAGHVKTIGQGAPSAAAIPVHRTIARLLILIIAGLSSSIALRFRFSRSSAFDLVPLCGKRSNTG